MERLTNKDGTYTEIIVDSYKGIDCSGIITHKNEATVKLAKLEDLEEQIGCPLEVVLSTSEVEVVKDNKIYKSQIMGVNNHTKSIMIGTSWGYSEFPLSLYGKTWWLKTDRGE